MNRSRAFQYVCGALAVAFGTAFLTGCAPQQTDMTAALEAVPCERNEWDYLNRPGHRITTQHYDIYTTIDNELLIEALPQFVETAYQFYSDMVPPDHEPEQRMQVYLFADRAEWANFTKRYTGPRAETFLKVRNGGYSERGVSVMEYVTHSVTFPLMAHEGWHQYLYHCVNKRIPAWLNEGMAVYFEGQHWGNIGLKRFDPWNNPRRRNLLAEVMLREELIPLDRLLEINAGVIVGESTRKISAYYGQVWSLVLFLLEGQEGKYAEGFKRLLSELSSPELESYARAAYVTSDATRYNYGRALFSAFISDDVETVEQEYIEFLRARILGAHE